MLYPLNSPFMLLTLLLGLLTSCSLMDSSENNNKDVEFFVARYDMNQIAVSNVFDQPAETGVISYGEMDEISGMVVSRQDPNLFWVHNDSGDWNRVFLLNQAGQWKGTFLVSDVLNRDWEDIAIGPGPMENIDYIYVGEIGDNNAQYDVKYIYRFPEPDVTTADTTQHYVTIKDVETIAFVYPGNVKMDAEVLLIDPWTKDLYIVTKREMPATVYRLPYPQSTTQKNVAIKYGTLPFTFSTAGDISADGTDIIIKTYDKAFLWTRQPGESMADAFMRAPIRVPYTPEPQGEAVAFPVDKSGFFTTSEIRQEVIPSIYFYKKRN